MGKSKQKKPQFNQKQPSFLQGKRDHQSSEKEDIETKNKRVDKQIQKEKIKESRDLGLPTGIDRDDIQKFNAVLEKHGDKSQNKSYLESIDKIASGTNLDFNQQDQEFVKIVQKGAQCGNLVLETQKECQYVDFNNENDFNPDVNTLDVAKKCWNWLLQPLGLQNFVKSNPKISVFKGRGATFFDQMQEDDHIISEKMIYDHISLFENDDKPLQFGSDLEMFQIIELQDKSQIVKSEISEQKVTLNVLKQLVNKLNFNVKILKPQEFSVSLRKLLCLSEELFQQTFTAQVLFINKFEKPLNQKKENFDQYILIFQGNLVIDGSKVAKGDMVFVPRGQSYDLTCSGEEKCIILTLNTNQQDSSVRNFLEISVKKALKSSDFENSLPMNFLFNQNSEDVANLNEMFVAQLSKKLLDKEILQKSLNSIKKQFMKNRIGPLELLQPNEEVEVSEQGEPDKQSKNEEDQQMDQDDESGESEKDQGSDGKSEKSDINGEYGNEGEMGEDDFIEVKLCTKYCAFLKKSAKGNFILFSTKNSSFQGDFPLLKQQIDDSMVKVVDKIVSDYPKYSKISELGVKKGSKEYQKLFELASQFQIFVVQ